MRKTIFWIHLSVGLVAGLVILIMSVTGVLLMYQRQITNWADRGAIQPVSPSGSRLPIETVLEKLAATESAAPTAITVSNDPTAPINVAFGREKVLFVDPYSGAVLGEGSKRVRAFFQSMIEWHRWLGMSGDRRDIGKAITGACNLGFLFLVLSGFYLWWPRNRNLRALKTVTLFDRSLSGKARDWNWHNVIGFWSALPLAILVFTATFFSYPKTTEWLYRLTGETPPPRPAPRANSSPATTEKRPEKKEEAPSISNLGQYFAQAEAQVPGWRTISLRVPTSSSAPLAFTIDRGNGARPDLRGQLTFNQQTGAIEKWEAYDSNSAARKIRLWVRWLHTGEAGGWLGQTIAGLASAGGAVLVWTGFALAFRRFFKKKASLTSVSMPKAEAVEV